VRSPVRCVAMSDQSCSVSTEFTTTGWAPDGATKLDVVVAGMNGLWEMFPVMWFALIAEAMPWRRWGSRDTSGLTFSMYSL
jgi:hypothetical protein